MLLRRTWILAVRAVKGYFADNCSQRAAALSYYVLFSLFPLIIFTVGILGFVIQDAELQADIVDEVMANIPLSQDEGRSQVADALQDVARTQSGAIGVFGLLGLGWSASAVFGVLRSALNVIFSVKSPRPPVIQKLLDLGTVLSFAPFFLLSIAATSALRQARHTSEDIPVLGDWAHALGFGWVVASITLPILISCVAFFLVYWLAPAQRVRAVYILPGAIIAAALFEAVKIGFNVYLENFSNYDVVFGSLGAVVAFLFWVYLSANILLFGAEIAAKMPEVAAGAFDERPAHVGPRMPFGQQVRRFLRSLVIRPHEDEKTTRDQP